MDRRIYTVTQINLYVKSILEDDVILNGLYVRGEVSNLKYHGTGHIYFTLKDENAAINAVMFKSNAELLPFRLENGMQILIFGYVSIFEKTGQYQLYAEIIEPAGKGSLQLAFEQLKTKLEQEGLFDQDYKKPIPSYPSKVGIVTSLTGAAIQDIITVAQRRNKNVSLLIAPAQVQGNGASETIVRAIESLNRIKDCDLIIVGRGGGSIEDLWAFNEENVARAIFKSEIPVISAVGHETDFTIADFVADLRASTPSAAAELAIPCLDDQIALVNAYTNRLNAVLSEKLNQNKTRLQNFVNKLSFKNLLTSVYHYETVVENKYKLLNNIMCNRLQQNKALLDALSSRLESVSPIKVMSRGYGIVYDREGKNIIKSISGIKTGDEIKINLKDGSLKAAVTETQINKETNL